MSLIDVQKEVHEFTKQFEPKYWPAHEILAHLIQEVGELAREVSHLHGYEKKKFGETESKLGEEIVDVIFTLGCLANSQDIYLQKEFEKKMNNLWKRDKDRFKKKE